MCTGSSPAATPGTVTPDLEGPCHLFCSPEAALDGESQDWTCPTGGSCLSCIFAQSVPNGTCSRTMQLGATAFVSAVLLRRKHAVLLKPPGIHSEFFVRQ